MRLQLAKCLGEFMIDRRWAELFDDTVHPDWKPVAKTLLRQERPQAPVADGSRRSCVAPKGHGTAAPADCNGDCNHPSGSAVPGGRSAGGTEPAESAQAQSSDSAREELRCAIRWAVAGDQKPASMEVFDVDRMIAALPEDGRRRWLRRYKEEGGLDPDTQDHNPAPAMPATLGKWKKPRSRKNRSYCLTQTVALVKEYMQIYKKKAGQRRQRGSIKMFLSTTNCFLSKSL